MTIEEIKKQKGTKENRDKLWQLFIDKTITLVQYREIIRAWDEKNA